MAAVRPVVYVSPPASDDLQWSRNLILRGLTSLRVAF
jgi:hypothetical protein